MEPTKQRGDASSSEPPADLDGRLEAMPHGDPSSWSWPQQPRSVGPPSPLLVNPPQYQPQGQALQDLEKLRELWSQPQPQLYGVDESSSGAGDASPAGTRSRGSGNIWDYYKHGPRFAASTVPHSSVVRQPGNLSTSAKEFKPSVAQSSSTPRFSANQRQPSASGRHHPAAAAASVRGDNANLEPSASALLSTLPADQVDLRSLEEVRALLLSNPLVPGHVKFAGSSAHVVRLLEEGHEDVRLSVLAGVKGAMPSVMGSSEWCVVFLELLRAGRVGELQGIVEAVCEHKDKVSLMRVAQHDYGEASLKELITAVAPHPHLFQQLIDCLPRDGLVEQRNGRALLHHIFTTLPTEIREEIILSQTSAFAKGKHSYRFLQGVLESDGDHGQLKECITKRVVQDLVSLSVHPFGNYVVQACFRRIGSLTQLQLVLTAFLGLHDDQLIELVQSPYANNVVRHLLKEGQTYFPEATLALAQQIEKLPLPASVLEETCAKWVMRVVQKVLSNQPLH